MASRKITAVALFALLLIALPFIALSISASVGFLIFSRRAAAAMIWPGWQ